MTEIVTPENRSLYTDILDDMFRMRYRIAVRELGWKIPGIEPGYDKDEFDIESTVYILVLSDDRKSVLGCTRFNKTTEKHMLTDIFPHYCDLQPIPRSPHVFECSRYMIDRKACGSKEKQTQVRQHLGLGMTEYCMSVGVTKISWLTHQAFYHHTISVLDTEPLGLPQEEPSDNSVYIAALSNVDEKTWRRQRENLVVKQEHITQQRIFLTPRSIPSQSSEAA